MKSGYEIQAEEFLRNHNAKMKICHISGEYGEWKTSTMTGGWLYRVRIDRNGKTWSFQFSDSVYNKWNNKKYKDNTKFSKILSFFRKNISLWCKIQ